MTYEKVKTGIIKILSKVKDIDIFFTKNEDSEVVKEYFYVTIKPIINESMGSNVHKKIFFIDIMYSLDTYSYLKYIAMAERIDKYVRPYIDFGDICPSVFDTKMKIVDENLHFTFSFEVIYKYDVKTDDMDKMENINILMKERE